jgi:signal transduction histidine kinase
MKRLCFVFIVCFSIKVVAQHTKSIEALIGHRFDTFQRSIQSEVSNDKVALKLLCQILYHKGQNKEKDSLQLVKAKKMTAPKNTLLELCTGYYYLYNSTNPGACFYHFDNDMAAKETNTIPFVKLSLLGFLELYRKEIVQSNEQFKTYLQAFKELATTQDDQAWLLFYTNYFYSASIFKPEDYYTTSKHLVSFFKKNSLSLSLQARYLDEIGLYYNRIYKNDSAIWYFNKLLQLPDKPYLNNHKLNANLDMVEIMSRTKKFAEAKRYLNLAETYYNKSDSIRSYFYLDRFKALYYYEKIPKYDSAYYYLKQSIAKEHQLDYRKNTLKISELNVRLRTAEKEKEILQQKNQLQLEERKQTTILIVALIIIFFGGITSYLIYKNLRRKRFIAEQEREIEKQKTDAILKEQEITIINAMIDGQEKERKELAEALHDTVSSTLASANMQLTYFIKNQQKLKNSNDLLSKIASHITAAYEDVHNMAHLKNSGVMAQKGLLTAVKDLAKNVSITNKIHIEVKGANLKNRIKNALEISIFRIIQELVNNIIKHANADEASISINHYDAILGIIVEDNGQGFQFNDAKNNGMGLSSIERRIENLGGTFEIDSFQDRGTTVLIDIPIP